ncbi:MAG: [NiFe]-hydrogenase assembly chaperone HybE [Candidatus Thiodiazotropha sp.]
MICPDYLTEGLEQSYRRIQRERMRDLPFLNPALRVKAVGFRHWQGRCLGVLITPWFMNLMLLPCEGDEWQELQIGDKQRHLLPSGSYEFIVGEEAGIGRYQMCSLFSPMFEFADQETAEATALAAMEALMDAHNRDSVSTREREISRRWHGEPEPDESGEASSPGAVSDLALSERLEQPISRRELLRGRITSERDT